MKKKKVLVLGWDAADWKVINKLMGEGLMPTFKSFLEESSYGNIATLDPPYSPMLWTSIATGKYPHDHGVIGFTEVLPDGTGTRPVTAHSRKVKAIWNMLNQEGYKSNVVTWWPSNPVEDINGVMVSNFYQHAKTKHEEDWPLLDGTINSDEHRDILADLRVHPGELTAAHIKPFLPNLEKLNIEEDKVLGNVAKIIAHTSCVHNATTYLIEETEWDFMAVYHDAIDHCCHLAMKFREPMLEGIDPEKHENYKYIVDSMYRFHDMMLEQTLKLIDDDTYVMIVSDHGFRSDHTRIVTLPVGPATPAIEHDPYGIVALKGPGIKKGHRIFGASVLDVTPTLLAIMGLPIGKDMAGNIMTGAFETLPQPEYIDSWETRHTGNPAMLDRNAVSDPIAEQQAMEQLIELGYVDRQEKDSAKRTRISMREEKLNLVRSYIHAGKKDKALPILEQVCEEFPNKASHIMLLNAYLESGKLSKAETMLETCKKEYPESNNVQFYEGLYFWQKNHRIKAQKIFNKLVESNEDSELTRQIGKTYNAAGMHQDAARVLQVAYKSNPNDAFVCLQIGFANLRIGEYEKALDYLLQAVEIYYHFPNAHHFIGEALYNLEMYEGAAEAFELAATMAPNDVNTRKWLVKVYKEQLDLPDKAEVHATALPDKEKEIIIVSGLPRSGTSMMMRILDYGGIEPYTDNERTADDHNPHGYYELEEVKNMANDVKWMPNAEGKSVKIIAQLLPYLPAKHKYKIIFMEREISEVLISQQLMLGKTREEAIKNYPFKLAQTYFEQLERVNNWVEDQPFIEMIRVNYSDMIEHPEENISRVCTFLDRNLDDINMLNAIDKKLYRNQTT